MRRLVMRSTILTIRTLRTTALCPLFPECRLRCQPLVHLLEKPILKTLCRERRMDQGSEVTLALAAAIAVLWEPPVHLSTDLLSGGLDNGGYLDLGPRIVARSIFFETIGNTTIELHVLPGVNGHRGL